jgi:1-deoxy-D-xylulose 5-phosphate reductoisomerase
MAVAAFLAGRSTFLDIFRTVEHALSQVVAGGQTTLGDIIAADADIRARLAR